MIDQPMYAKLFLKLFTISKSAMHFLEDFSLLLYYWLESLLFFFYPRSLRQKDISSDVALITGAGSGLGRKLALRFSQKVAKLVLVDINEAGLKETINMIKTIEGCSCYMFVCDISKNGNVQAMAEKIHKEVGNIDILVNNAGVVSGKKFLDLDEANVLKTFSVNALALYWTCKAFLPHMRETNHGHIITISSVAALCGVGQLTDYCGSKFAANGFHESLWLETKSSGFDGIHFTLVCPHLMGTGMFQGAHLKVVDKLNPDYVADQIMSGFLTNQDLIYIPRVAYYLHSLKPILPVKCLYVLNRMMGGTEFMSNFTGRTSTVTNGVNGKKHN
ncbi:short-chain dehydrogenase/reductase family 16C member 6-like [Brevipalpus obovatus]|uniref:short-chain dehydrogenase/reductase family 16C member 6-like n=1 Tax=Brevipalpus obovatus TaxID=246614 RepID=UPI003D9DC300